ncbi:MAG: acyltransferase family protein [Microgenomates group bacterium]
MKQGIHRSFGIDILRVIAMLGVIFLHTIDSFTVRADFFLTKAWFVFEPLSAISRSSLALFFMISGYLVINKNRTVSENLKITISRIVIPLISFSILSSFFYIFKTGKSIQTAIDPTYVFGDAMKLPDNWLWFLEILLFLYLLNPLWQELFSDKSKRTSARYITFFFFFFASLIILLKFIIFTPNFFNRYTAWIAYICCYLYGALVKNEWHGRKSVYFYTLLFLIGLVLQIGGTYYSILSNGRGAPLQFAGYFSDNIAIPSLLMAVGLFNMFIDIKEIKIGGKKISFMMQKIIQTFAVLSYGIYLTHEFISQTLFDIVGWSVDSVHINIYLYNVGVFAITLFGSAVITYIISRIPKLRMIVGISS